MNRPTESQRRQWNEEGYNIFENAVTGDMLRRLQEAHRIWSDACKEEWLDRVEAGDTSGTYYDVPDPFQKDDVFVDLVDHPSWYGFLMDFTGDQVVLLGPQVRTVPNSPVSYTQWHQDVGADRPLHIKVQVYVNDVEDGAFGFIPGSHKEEGIMRPYVHRLRSMPGHKVFSGKAGNAIMFNARGFHAAMENMSGECRRSIILIYEKWSEDKEQTSQDRFASISHLCTTPERRRIFGLERPCPA